MIYEEALEIIQQYHYGNAVDSSKYMSAMDLVEFALEKQMPKKRILKEDILGLMVSVCPYCGESVHNNFCRICGQAIDWGDGK